MRDGARSQFVRRLARGRKFQKEGDCINRVVIDSYGKKGLVPRRQALNSTIVSEGQGGNVNLAVQNENSGRITRSKKKNKDGVLARRKRRLADVFENIENENEEVADEFVSNKANNGDQKELKWKRRRPRIIDLRAQDNALASDDMHSTRPMIMLREGDELFVHLQGPSMHDDLAAELRTKQFAWKLILRQLLAAGWRVERIPKKGSEYDHDVMYVSLEGKSHKLITLAYRRLQRHYEANEGEGKVYRPGFQFAPVPEMIVNVLKNLEVGSCLDLGDQGFTLPYRMSVQGSSSKKQNKKHTYYGEKTVLSWMIDVGAIRQGEQLYYMDRRGSKYSVLLNGSITRGGIHCSCCNEIVSISGFEAHSRSQLSDPLRKICIEGGASLLLSMLQSWNKQHIAKRRNFHFIDPSEDSHDDICIVCGDGGDTICCDSCTSIIHRSCLGITEVPSGDWHCINCCCKFCGLPGRYADQIDSTHHSIEPSLFTCRFCERKYHKSCLEANCGMTVHSANNVIFCGQRCKQLCERLERLLGVKHELEDGLSWSFICRSDVDDPYMRPHMVECNSKLAVALSLMEECFMPPIDHRTGINVMLGVLYNIGSNFERLNFERFVTAILEKDDEIICAASIRIHENHLAEMPYITTNYAYRRQGMCRRFLKAIESALRSFNVDLLVIPAVSEVKDTWISAFGFEPLAPITKQIIKNMNLVTFLGVESLQKKISEQNFSYENLIPAKVSNLQKNKGVHMGRANLDQAGTSGSG